MQLHCKVKTACSQNTEYFVTSIYCPRYQSKIQNIIPRKLSHPKLPQTWILLSLGRFSCDKVSNNKYVQSLNLPIEENQGIALIFNL